MSLRPRRKARQGILQRPARGSDDAIFEVAMTLFFVEDRSDDAAIRSCVV